MNADKTPPQNAKINIGSIADLTTTPEVFLMHLPPEVIVTTEDKLRLWLSKHLKRMERKRGWVTPLGILIPIVVTLNTVNFKDTGFVDAATWKAIFIIAGVLLCAWLIYSVIETLRSEKIADIIDELKKHSDSLIKFVKK